MVDFWAVATSPVAVNKFFHTVLSGWVLGGVFVVGISCWFLLKKRNREFALASIKIGAISDWSLRCWQYGRAMVPAIRLHRHNR